jgi:hypothetical protein
MKKLKYILKLYHVINHIIFIFHTFIVDVKVKDDKYFGIDGVANKYILHAFGF